MSDRSIPLEKYTITERTRHTQHLHVAILLPKSDHSIILSCNKHPSDPKAQYFLFVSSFRWDLLVLFKGGDRATENALTQS